MSKRSSHSYKQLSIGAAAVAALSFAAIVPIAVAPAATRSLPEGTLVPAAQDMNNLRERAEDAAAVLEEVMETPESSIPSSLLDDAVCVAVIPRVVKVGFVFGGRYGRGLVSCRTDTGWSRPSFLSIGGGSFGLQIGGQATDFVLVFMNRRAAQQFTDDGFTLGADASVSAGPVGRTAEAGTDVTLRAEIYSYSRSRGLFAGVALEGAKVSPDQDANWAMYGERVIPQDLLFGSGGSMPAAVEGFVQALQRSAPGGS